MLVVLAACETIAFWDLKSDADINVGRCYNLVRTLLGILVEGGVFDAVHVDGRAVAHIPEHAHSWVYWCGRHYDAEAPEGVEDWRDLPFCKGYAQSFGLRRKRPLEAQRLELNAQADAQALALRKRLADGSRLGRSVRPRIR